MKIFFKIPSLILSFCMILSVATYADGSPKNKLLYQSNEITSLDELHERAKLGINDFDISKLPESITKSKYILKDKHGNTQPLDTIITTQLLDQVQTENGVNETYAVNLLGTGSLSDEEMDDSISVKAYSTIYFTRESSPDTIILTRASGGWQINDTSVSVHDRFVHYGTSGVGPNGYVRQIQKKIPTSNSFNYTTGFTKEVFLLPPAGGDWTAPIVGVFTECTLKRGTSSTWSLELSNNY